MENALIQRRKAVSNALMDFAQGASNSAASAVSAPVDGIAWLLRKAGVPIPQAPVGGSDWMAQRGLTRSTNGSTAGYIGEAVGGVAPMVAAAKAPQVANALLQAGDNLANAQRIPMSSQRGAIVWHGSPHKFDRFDSSKINTGEGAQAYGHGLYLAESPDVAKSYQALSPTVDPPPVRTFRGAELDPGTPQYHAARLADEMGLARARKMVSGWLQNPDPRMVKEAEGWRQTLDLLNQAASKSDFKRLKNSGSLYKVDLPDSAIARMLDWDKPLSQQAPEVAGAVARMFPGTYSQGRYIDPMSSGKTGRALLDELTAIADKRGAPGFRTAEPALRQAGIPGIRYLDGGSRGAGSGTSNFVVFPGEESLLRILERNGISVK